MRKLFVSFASIGMGLKKVRFCTLILAATLSLPAESSLNNIGELQRKIFTQSTQFDSDDPMPEITAEIKLTENETPAVKSTKRKTYVTFFDNENAFRQTTRKKLLEEVETNWQMSSPKDPILDDHSATGSYENTLFEKANRITIPRVRFIDTPLSRVIESLANLAEVNDSAVDDNGKGMNIVLLGMESVENEPVVNLNLKNISFYRLVELITQSISYQFDITDDAIIIYRRDLAEGILDTQFFPISRATLVRLTGIQGINHHIYNAPGSPENVADEEHAIKEFFQRAGINFKDVTGSNLAFDGSQIIVTNTGRNLIKISNILRKYSEVKQVEIETKFLEVQQGVLDELGFRWQFGSKKNDNKIFFQTGETVDNSRRDNLRTLVETFASTNFSRGDGKIVGSNPEASPITLPNQPPGLPGQINLGASATPLANFTGVLNSIQCNAMIQALEQHAGSDLMSAPKLTVLSGKTAKIVIAMELRYPQSYGDTHSEVGTGYSGLGASSSAGVTITAGTPQNFTTRNVGVEMSVTPIVEMDGSISLQLEPKVTEFEGFVEYGGVNVAVTSGNTVTIPSGFYQPIFSTREIHTEVNVFDGATVVMGGLTREEIKEVNDKVPILGDIPLLGRLFRSKSETIQKRNLLIFVTAHTISPLGNKKLLPNVEQSTTVPSQSPK
ncbi:MAG: type II and III secretion system protein [Puniceicoccales bacterium]|jgi:general secretion pathway protein D|nr:type II and III secretion system protein [Puniceicoccales bacterium]